ncbi:MAG: ISNCY family transposase [Candidatus Acidiferrales bacterium]
MSRKELSRVEVLGRVKARSLRLRDAAEMLGLSYRQTKRVWARYRNKGAKALQHGNCGRASNRAYPAKFRAAVLQQVQARYEDFGPTLAAEHLASDDGLEVHAETLRRWLKEVGWWHRQRRRKPYRQRREAKQHFGELVQLDGSFHEWLEERGPRGCLMHMVDDATTEALGYFSEEETIWAAAGVLRRWIERYGVPQALYTDWKNVYVRPPNAEERARGEPAVTQFGRMCAKLGIRILAASSPQAKGRVERAHGTHQDRLVKKLRLAGIVNYQQANAFLEKRYLAEHNRRYAHAPVAQADYHRRRPTARQLDEVFWLEEERVVSEDWVVRYHNRLLQLERQSRHWAPAQSRVWVRENEAGEVAIHYRDRRVGFRELGASPATSEARGAAPFPAPPSPPLRRSLGPASNHPWRLGFELRNPSPLSEAG